MQEENLPLILKPAAAENHDIEHILRDVFQEILEKPKYPKNVAKNLLKNNVQCVQVKDGAKNVQNIINYSLLSTEDIGIVEEKIMYRQGEYLMYNKRLETNKCILESKLLTRQLLIKSIDRPDLIHYGLIEGDDLLPNIFTKSMDFSINENEHKCKPCISQINLIPNPPDVEESKPFIKKKRKLKEVKSFQSPFRLNTNKVVFCNYGINKTYKKQFRLQNVSNVVQTFAVHSLPKTRFFKVHIEGNTNRICPGLSATFVITFKTNNYLDVEDTIVINSTTVAEDNNNPQSTVLLASYRDAPNLFMYVYKNISSIKNSSSTFDISRSIALNNSIDCGASFLSQMIQIFLIVKNNGGNGKFFFMNEESWFDSNINNLYTSLDLEVGSFLVTPAYFEILADEYLVISIEFCPKAKGVNLEKLVLLCNNATYEKLDIIADGVIFDRHCISLGKDNLIPIENLAYILYAQKDQSIEYVVNEDGDVFDNKEICTLEDMADLDYEDCSILTSNNVSSFESHANDQNPNTLSEALMAYLKDTKYGISEGEAIEYEKYHYHYLLFFETVIPFKSNTKCITINNNCLIDLEYYWKIDDRGSDKLGYNNLKDLDRRCLEISKTPETCLPSYSTLDFNITITPDFITDGFNRLLLSLYIKSVPKCAIEDLKHFIIVEYPTKELVDILIATFDVVCRIPPVIIDFYPSEIFVNNPLEYDEIYELSFSVKILNEDKNDMDCHWSISNKNISIQPNELTMKDNENIQFTLMVHNTSYTDINDKAVFNVNNFLTKNLPIFVKVKRPVLIFEYEILDFGWLQVGNKYSKKIIILNNNYVSVSWELWENYSKIPTGNSINISFTNLEDNNIEIEYTIDAKEEGTWESHLLLYTLFNGKEELDSICQIKYSISKFQAYMHTTMSYCPILAPKEVLYINTKYSYVLCIHNITNIPTCYYFGKPYGSKSELLDVEIIRSVGYLEANRIVQVDIKIIPKTVGVMDEVYVPCYFKTCNSFLTESEQPLEPVILAIVFVAEDIFVNVTFPVNKHGNEEVITWPPSMKYDFDYEYVDYENLDEHEECNNIASDKCEEICENTLATGDCNLIDDISTYLNSIMYPCIGEEDEQNSKIPVPNNSQETFDLSSDSELTISSPESLRHYFNKKDYVFQENIIEFFDVPLHKVIRKTITIENCTTMIGSLNVETVNFNPVYVTKRKIDKVLERMNIKQFDESEKMLSKHGIWITTEIESTHLAPNGNIKVDILVYANTWGTYVEELLIEINNILPLCITILVDVVGLPLEFQMFKNNIHKYPLFRFGTLPYKSNVVNRKIYFKNTSFVPITVVWHIFLKTKDLNDKPITLVFDVFHPNLELRLSDHDSMGNLMLMHGKYFGQTEQYIFNIEPKESFINQGDTKCLDISFDPTAYAAHFKPKKVEAYLIGYIQVAEQFRFQSSMFLRKTGSQMQYLKMKLSATLELPILELNLVKGDLKFIFYASTVMDQDSKQIKILCFKNFHKSDAIVTLTAEKPLAIDNIETINGISMNKEIVVSPDTSLEVQISYRTNKALLTAIAESLYSLSYDQKVQEQFDFNTYAYNETKYIHIKQKGTIKQHVPVEIITYFPFLEMTNELEFGFVFVGNNKKQILTIWNYTCCPVPFILESTGDVIINPAIGKLDSAKHNGPSHVDVSVIFIPRAYKAYVETISLSTNVPGFTKTATLHGIGSHDEKYFSPDQC